MKLLNFIHGAAPQHPAATFDPARSAVSLTVPRGVLEWRAVTTSHPPAGTMLVALEDGSLHQVEAVLEMQAVSASMSVKDAQATEADVMGQDFRTKKGRQLDKARQEFGRTTGTVKAKPVAMDREEQTSKLLQRVKRGREDLDRRIEMEVGGGGGSSAAAAPAVASSASPAVSPAPVPAAVAAPAAASSAPVTGAKSTRRTGGGGPRKSGAAAA